jgi:hypothetical protein
MWLSADPAMGEYVPLAPINDDAKQHNKELPGMGGVYNYVNLHAYHYAGNNPVKLTDPDGKIFVESPEMKKNKDPNNERGYKINVSFYASAKIFVQLLPAVDRSRSESGIQGDKGEMSLVENFPSADVWLLGNPERRGPVVDRLAMEIYIAGFGGEMNENGMIAPSGQSYKQVRNRIGAIWGLVAYLTNKGSDSINAVKNDRGLPLADDLSIGQEWANLTQEERDIIRNTIKEFAQEGKINYIE